MNQVCFAVLAILLPNVQAEGYPKESPDVPFNTGKGGDSIPGSGSGYPPVSMDYDSRYRGPVAMLMVLPDGHIADTADVSAARAAHLAALDKAKSLWSQMSTNKGVEGTNNGYNYPQPGSESLEGNSQNYLPPGGTGTSGSQVQGGSSSANSDGYDYPSPGSNSLEGNSQNYLPPGGTGTSGSQVQGGSSSANSEGYDYPSPGSNSLEGNSQNYLPPGGTGTSGSQVQGGSLDAAGSVPYNGPLAMLMVLPSGYLADTPEIAALRAAHLSALLKAQEAWKPHAAAGMQH